MRSGLINHIEQIFSNSGYVNKTGQTRTGTFRTINSNSLDTQQVANRNSKSWATAEFIIVEDEVDETLKDKCLKGFKSLTSGFNDQYLILFSGEESFIYNGYGNLIGNIDKLPKLLSVTNSQHNPLQVIYYGSPGTGKSYRIKRQLEGVPNENIFRTTFHPDSDYATFVGAYKPTMRSQARYSDQGVRINYHERDERAHIEKGDPIMDRVIEYEFVPQAFLKAYERAYLTEEPVYLIIEEINRGNCAQVFGDLFQLLDRDDSGWSEYPIKADEDIKRYLVGKQGEHSGAIQDGELRLPPNLYIWATMNTSDQSLFPIDSAFKRRWDWEYEPIKYSVERKIKVGDKEYSWVSFQRNVNKKILKDTRSEDKMLGDYFVNPSDGVITEKMWVNKILFYLWNDVYKDGDGDIFTEELTFSDLFDTESQDKMIQMMVNLEVKEYSEQQTEEVVESIQEGE